MTPEWMKLLSREKDNEDFSQLCHDYFKLATMRVMQEIRDKYSVPKEDIITLTLTIFARFLNEGCYAVGAAIKNGTPLKDILEKKQQLTLLRVLSNEPLDTLSRDDIDTGLKSALQGFREFILSNASDFYIQD